ncbi:MAG: neutral ceramidase, partial [Myxococcota bacterium]
MFASTRLQGLVLLLCVGTVACSDAPDALVADVVIIQPPTPAAGPAGPAHCAYESETQRPWRAPTPGAVQAGVARVVLDVPIGTPLAPYGGRLKALGGIPVDDRESPLTTAFVPSVGIQSSPAATALVLQAGDELLVWVKLDLGLSVETLLYDLEARLADAVPGGLAGHVLVTVSHGHSGWGAYHPGQVMSLGADRFRPQVYGRILDGAEAAVRSALASLAPARIGLGIQDGWDPQRRIYDDRRPQNDGLPEDDGGAVGSTRDERLWILRVDNDSGPLAAVVSFGFHGNIAREVNALASIEAGGLVELELQERLGPGVVVMHALSAAGDADATGVSSLPPCEVSPCADFAQMESVGQLAADTALALHASIETSDRVGLSFASRTVALGRDLEIREGALRYAPADAVPDRVVWTADGAIANPIDEFAAPDGAALCGGATPDLPLSPIDGVEDLSPWGTCVDLSLATGILTALFGTQPGGTPFCETVRTVVGGLRLADIPLLTIGADGTQAQSDAEDVLVATLPGEPVSLWARTFRERSPRGPERTLLLGYAQDYVGYLLSAEDWMSGGFEPSINVWGPLEGEFLMEHALAL